MIYFFHIFSFKFIISISDRYAKRGRYAEDGGGGALGSSGPGGGRDYSPPRSSNSRTLQSSVVVMPTIETKSRAAVINALKKSENKEDQVRWVVGFFLKIYLGFQKNLEENEKEQFFLLMPDLLK